MQTQSLLLRLVNKKPKAGAAASTDSGITKPTSLYRHHKICYCISMSYTEKDKELDKMKEQMSKVIDINYKRYNNEYMDIAFERERAFKEAKEREAKQKEREMGEEASSEIHGIMKGRKSFRI